jgi:predicted transcriptional regulator
MKDTKKILFDKINRKYSKQLSNIDDRSINVVTKLMVDTLGTFRSPSPGSMVSLINQSIKREYDESRKQNCIKNSIQ